jgi:hypothetical protein
MFVFLKEVLTDGCTIVYRSWDACDDPIPKLIEFHTLILINAVALACEEDGVFHLSFFGFSFFNKSEMELCIWSNYLFHIESFEYQ